MNTGSNQEMIRRVAGRVKPKPKPKPKHVTPNIPKIIPFVSALIL
jgi:hypothetical protein